jgi:hypothetical protein
VDLDTLRQGDALRIALLPAAVIHEDGGTATLGAEDIELRTGLALVISQECDIVAGDTTEPWIMVAPVEDVGVDLYQRSWSGRLSPRLFALPPFADLTYPAVNLVLVAAVQKRLLVDDVVEAVPVPFEPADRRRLREWLGRRLGRHAFPDHLEDHLLRPLRRRLAKRYDSNQEDGPLVRAIEGVWIATAEDGASVEVLLVVEPGTRAISQLDDESKIDAAAKLLMRPLYKKANEAGYRVQPRVAEPGEITAYDLLYRYNEIELDLPRDAAEEE